MRGAKLTRRGRRRVPRLASVVALAAALALPFAEVSGPVAAQAAASKTNRASVPPPPPFVASVQAASGPTLSYFAITTPRGKTTQAGRLTVYNRSARAVHVVVDPVDAITANTLGSAYEVLGLPIHGVAHWTQIGARRLVLPPHGTRSVSISVRVPRSATPGDYLSGIAIQATRAPVTERIRSNVAISSVVRYAIGLEVTLPGPRHPGIVLTGASVERQPSAIVFLLAARNTGNVILKNVTGSILITQGRRTVANVPILPGTFVTGTSLSYPVRGPRENPPEGTVYRVRAQMRYDGGVATLDRTVVFGGRQAKLQAQFTGHRSPPSRAGSSSGTILIPALAALAVIAALAGIAGLRRRRERLAP